jgi:tripeptide aminopeptidase
MIDKERLLNTFMEYVQIDSESKNEKAMSEKLVEELKSLGFDAFTDDSGKMADSTGNNVYCYIPGTLDLEPLLFSAHMDTVTPGIDIVPYIEDGYVKSKGDTILGGDNKAGISAVMEALRTIKEHDLPHRPIEVVFSICEEVGLLGAKYLDYDKLKSKNAIILDSGGNVGKIIVQAPGQAKLNAKIIGKPSHAGVSPESGISAIMVGAEAVTNMKLLRIDEETTANIGTFKAEGATNIVSPEVILVAEARSLNKDKLDIQVNHMVKCLLDAAEKYDAKVDYKVDISYYPYALKDDDKIVNIVEEKCKKLGFEVSKAPSGGGSDANVYNNNGISAVNLGNGTELVHTLDERLNIDEFENLTKLVLELMI